MKKLVKAIAAIMLMTMVVFAAGCGKDDNSNNGGGIINNGGNNNGGGTNDEVTLITTTPQDITSTSAVCGGTVSVSDGITLSEVGVCWGTSSTPTVAGSHVSAGSVEEQFTCAVSGLEPDTKYYVRAYALCGEKFYYGNAKDFTTLNNSHDYVDLGLPSGTLWATCNVGATTPEGYGDYFAWGETQPKDYYDWDTYQHCNGDYDQLTKYCNDSDYGYNGFTDNLTVLQPSDDAATANWGSGWRMPTQAEFQELLNNTTVSWTQQNGVNGRLFTASNGNSLFLPAAGHHWGDEPSYAGSYGLYWSSSLYMDYPFIAGHFGYHNSDDYCYVAGTARGYGQSVRAVRSAK